MGAVRAVRMARAPPSLTDRVVGRNMRLDVNIEHTFGQQYMARRDVRILRSTVRVVTRTDVGVLRSNGDVLAVDARAGVEASL